MSAAQTIMTSSVLRPAPLYPFLAHPPPQKKRPTQPLPSPPTSTQKVAPAPSATVATNPTPPCVPFCGRRRSATTSSIAAWAANVHPGTPAPYSPRRSPSAFSVSVRRPSGSSVGLPSASFLSFFDTPTTAASRITPNVQDFKADLTAVGYTSFFVNIPCASPPPAPPADTSVNNSVKDKSPRRALKRFQSLSALRPSKHARTRAPPSPPVTGSHPRTPRTASKKAKYPKLRPPPLANELALAQLMGGGTIEEQARQYARRQAKAAGAVKEDGVLVGVGDVWRDDEGNVWMDREEAWEYKHLLGARSPSSQGEWVKFEEGARESLVSSEDSDLSPRYVMHAEGDAQDDLAAFTRASTKPGMTVLAIPARSRRAAKHLRKPEFLLDVFPVPHSPKANIHGHSAGGSPRIAAFRSGGVKKGKGKTRRRPAPLKLAPPPPTSKRPTNPADPEQIRRDFLEDSFAPPVPPKTRPSPKSLLAPSPLATGKMTPRSSILTMLAKMGTKKSL